MIQLPEMWEHQERQIKAVRKSLASGFHRLNLAEKDAPDDFIEVRAIVMQASPGFGKTVCAKWILGNTLNKSPDAKALFTVHRRNLVINASDSFNEEPKLPHGVVMSGVKTDWKNRLFVTSVDSMNNWWIENKKYRETADVYDVVVQDEIHFHTSKHLKFVKAHEIRRRDLGLKPAIYIGLSATPDNKLLSKLFREIVHGESTQWLIDNGYLVPFRYFHGMQGKTDLLVKGSGKMGYTDDSVVSAMDGMAGDLIRDWKRLAHDRPTVGFFPSLSQAKQASEWLNEAGVKTAYLDGSTSDEERADVFAQMANREIQYTCNVGVIEIGTNIPVVSCIQLCTKIGKRSRLEQILGRGSRTAEGKIDAIVIDHLGNISGANGLGFFEDQHIWTLEQSEPVADDTLAGRPIVVCPGCGTEYRGGLCINCGHQPTPKELKPQGLMFSKSDMKEIVREEKEKPKPKQQSMEKLIESSIYAAAHRNTTFSSAYMMAKAKAKKLGQKFVLPATITVRGEVYEMPGYGNPDSKRKVTAIFDFVKHLKK